MEKNLSNVIIYGNIEVNTLFQLKNNHTFYRYVSYTLDNLPNGIQKMLVIVYNYSKNKYEILDCSVGTKLYKKEVNII